MRTQSRLNTLFAQRSLLVVGLVCGAALTGAAVAQVKGIDITAPAGPGGGYDQLARATQQVLQKEGLASGVQVSNVPGAGGTIGLAQFVTGKKRGSNLMVAGLGLVGAVLTNKASITLDQVTPLARLQGEYQPLVVAANSPIKTLNDLISKYKADPGSVSWGGFALGSPDHILSGLIVKAIGGDATKMNYIVAGAGGEMLAQVMGGHITVATGGLNEFAQQLESGKLRALAISSPERLPGSEIPTLAEQGVAVDLANWRGVMAPPGLDEEEHKALLNAVDTMAKSDAWKKTLQERGWLDLYLSGEPFGVFLEAEQERVTAILKRIGLVQ